MPTILCDVRGPLGSLLNLAGLDSLTIDSANEGKFVIRWLMVGGNVGTIECHGATKLSGAGGATSGIFIAGDVTGGITLRDTPGDGFFADRIDEIIVDGNFLGSLGNEGQKSEISVLRVTGDIGTPSSPAVFLLFNMYGLAHIGTIECDNMYIDLGITGALRRVETQGVLVGDLDCIWLKVFNANLGVNNAGVFIGSGDLTGKISTWSGSTRFDADISIPGDISIAGQVIVGVLPSGRTISVGGNHDGTISTGSAAGTMSISGDVNGLIQVGAPFVSADLDGAILVGGILDKDGIVVYGDMGPAANITIASDFFSSITITGAHEGQIIINAANNSSLWFGDVSVDTTVLGPTQVQPFLAPFYEELSSNLGGGAVGLVPFNFHPIDSDPDHDTIVATVPSSVQVHHYGPVSIGSGTGVRVFEGSVYIPFGFSSVGEVYLCYEGPLNDFWTEVTDSFNITTNGRVVTVANGSGKFKKNRSYQIIPDGLVCDDVPGNPPVVYTSNWVGTYMGSDEYCPDLPETNGYGFIVPSGFDLNMSLSLETADIEIWVANPVDLDDDNDADTLDLVALIDAVVNGEGE